MNSTQTKKSFPDNLAECINMTDMDSEGGSAILPYRYFVDWFDLEHKETYGASGWPLSFSKIETLSPSPKISIVTEGSGVLLPDQRLMKSATIRVAENPANILPAMLRMFYIARDIEFEDGMENQLARGLTVLIRGAGQSAIDVLADLIPSGKINIEVGAEALRWVGRMRDPATYDGRRWLLERSLFSRFPRIRDGAALGLSSMNDPHSIQYVRFAIEREEIEELRADLGQLLQDLEDI